MQWQFIENNIFVFYLYVYDKLWRVIKEMSLLLIFILYMDLGDG